MKTASQAHLEGRGLSYGLILYLAAEDCAGERELSRTFLTRNGFSRESQSMESFEDVCVLDRHDDNGISDAKVSLAVHMPSLRSGT